MSQLRPGDRISASNARSSRLLPTKVRISSSSEGGNRFQRGSNCMLGASGASWDNLVSENVHYNPSGCQATLRSGPASATLSPSGQESEQHVKKKRQQQSPPQTSPCFREKGGLSFRFRAGCRSDGTLVFGRGLTRGFRCPSPWRRILDWQWH